ncbi:MAG TPA: hypothetical protein VKM72_33440 [Thermoanaerobaculia bacterium]|nr:hypothetical protein [Thermoanaerobaculia bacterium]
MKARRTSVLLALGLLLAAGMAFAGDPAPAVSQAPVCDAQALAPVPAPLDLFTPEAQPMVCPLIGCVNDQYCRRDRDCTTAPGGVCNLFCPTKGCCAYP